MDNSVVFGQIDGYGFNVFCLFRELIWLPWRFDDRTVKYYTFLIYSIKKTYSNFIVTYNWMNIMICAIKGPQIFSWCKQEYSAETVMIL